MTSHFDTILPVLLKNHKSDNIITLRSHMKDWDWAKQIKASPLSQKDGLLIFVGKKNEVLYVGQTEYISDYVVTIKSKYKDAIRPSRIFIILNENPSSKIINTSAYRALFNPTLNSNRDNRFLFDNKKTVLNVSPRCEKIIYWIKQHPTATRTQFNNIYTQADLKALCKCFSLARRNSFKDLKEVIINTDTRVKVTNRKL